jgi:hypothetical protein
MDYSAVSDLIGMWLYIHINVFSILIFGAFCLLLLPSHFTLPYLVPMQYCRLISIDASAMAEPSAFCIMRNSDHHFSD